MQTKLEIVPPFPQQRLTENPPKPTSPPSECLGHEALAKQDDKDGFFASPAFLRGFEQVFGDRALVDVLTLPASGGSDAKLPVMRCRVWRRPGLAPRYDYLAGDGRYVLGQGRAPLPLRQISPVLGLGAAHLRFSALRGGLDNPPAFWSQAARAIRWAPGWDIGLFPLPRDEIQTAARAFRDAGCATFLRPIERAYHTLEQPVGVDDLLARQSGKFRQNIRRAKALAEKDQIEITCYIGEDAIARLPRLSALAKFSWKGRGAQMANARGQSVLVPYAGEQQRFFETLAQAPALEPVLTLAAGEDHDEAACLSFRHGDTHVTSLIFQRPRTGAASYGRLVFQAQIDHAVSQGARRVDFNSSAGWVQPYSDTTTLYDNLLVIRPGLKGRILAGFARLKGGEDVA